MHEVHARAEGCLAAQAPHAHAPPGEARLHDLREDVRLPPVAMGTHAQPRRQEEVPVSVRRLRQDVRASVAPDRPRELAHGEQAVRLRRVSQAVQREVHAESARQVLRVRPAWIAVD